MLYSSVFCLLYFFRDFAFEVSTSYLFVAKKSKTCLSSCTSIIWPLSFSPLKCCRSIFQNWWGQLNFFFVFGTVYVAKLLKWPPCGGASDERSNDSNRFPWTAWKTVFCGFDSLFTRCSVVKCSWNGVRRNRNVCGRYLFFLFLLLCSLRCLIKLPIWFRNFASAALFIIDTWLLSPSSFFSLF